MSFLIGLGIGFTIYLVIYFIILAVKKSKRDNDNTTNIS